MSEKLFDVRQPICAGSADAEIERLTAELAEARDGRWPRVVETLNNYLASDQRLRAERDALRAALERIAECSPVDAVSNGGFPRIAREALRSEGRPHQPAESPYTEVIIGGYEMIPVQILKSLSTIYVRQFADAFYRWAEMKDEKARLSDQTTAPLTGICPECGQQGLHARNCPMVTES